MKPDHLPLFSLGNPDRLLSELEIRSLVAQAVDSWDLTRQRVLLIVPDGTRTAPVGQLFRLLHELLWGRVKALDVLVALGTHPPMSAAALNHLLGISAEEMDGGVCRGAHLQPQLGSGRETGHPGIDLR